MAVKRICPACRFNEHHQAGNPPGRQASTGFAMAARPVVRNRSAGDIHRQRTLDYHHAVGGGNRAAGICVGPAVGEADRAMGQLYRVPWSFCYAGVIWLNHRAVFARVRYCDRSLHLANLFLLLTSALIPLPTAILSAAIQRGNEFDARVAVTLYAGIAGSMCLAWLVVFHVLSVHPYLVEEDVDPDFFPKERFRAALGVVLYAIAGLAGWLSTPKLAMLIFLALPVFYGITSEGLTETRLRLQFGRAHRHAYAKADHEGLPPE